MTTTMMFAQWLEVYNCPDEDMCINCKYYLSCYIHSKLYDCLIYEQQLNVNYVICN